MIKSFETELKWLESAQLNHRFDFLASFHKSTIVEVCFKLKSLIS